MNGVWKDEEVKSLFEEVRLCKSQGRALREAFAAHAKKHFRKPNSVRNYYYGEIERLKKDEKRRRIFIRPLKCFHNGIILIVNCFKFLQSY